MRWIKWETYLILRDVIVDWVTHDSRSESIVNNSGGWRWRRWRRRVFIYDFMQISKTIESICFRRRLELLLCHLRTRQSFEADALSPDHSKWNEYKNNRCTRWCLFDTMFSAICHWNGDSGKGKNYHTKFSVVQNRFINFLFCLVWCVRVCIRCCHFHSALLRKQWSRRDILPIHACIIVFTIS